MEQVHKQELSAFLSKKGCSDFNTMDSYELENVELLELLIYMMLLLGIITLLFKKDNESYHSPIKEPLFCLAPLSFHSVRNTEDWAEVEICHPYGK